MTRPPFARITIVGTGLIGGSIGLALRRRMPSVQVTGVDRPTVLRRAMRRGVITRSRASLRPGLAEADLIILATPIETIRALLPRIARDAPPKALITDVAGAKLTVLEDAVRAGLSGRFIGGHPMTGSEHSGIANADAGLLRGALWLLCPDAPRAAIARLRRLVNRLGSRPRIIDPLTHDAIMSVVSHLPQLLSVALVNSAYRQVGMRGLRHAGPAFHGMSRLAASPAGVWGGVLEANRAPVDQALALLISELRALGARPGRSALERHTRAARIVRRMTRRRPV